MCRYSGSVNSPGNCWLPSYISPWLWRRAIQPMGHSFNIHPHPSGIWLLNNSPSKKKTSKCRHNDPFANYNLLQSILWKQPSFWKQMVFKKETFDVIFYRRIVDLVFSRQTGFEIACIEFSENWLPNLSLLF